MAIDAYASAPRAPAWSTSLDSITRNGLVLIVLVLFGVSGGMLWIVGYNYDGLFGSPVTKIHPATYLVVLLFAWRSLVFGNPVAYCVHVADRRPATALLLVIATALLITIILRQRPNMAGMIDTFIGPSLLVLMLADEDERLFSRLRLVLHGVMTANALLALFEFATHTLLFPYRLDGATFETDLRSTALQGHPLVNASITSIYILALLGGERSMGNSVKFMLVALQCAALVAFGGRSAMVITVLLGGSYVLYQGLATLRQGRVNLIVAAFALMLIALVPIGISVLAYLGFFDALLGRFVSDGGSANARIEMLSMFDDLSLAEIIVGPNVDFIESTRRIKGLEWGIENPFIRMTLYQGAFFTLLMTLAVGLFLWELARKCGRGIWLPMLAWVILLNTSESISSKTTLQAKFAVIVLCLYWRPRWPMPRPVNSQAWTGPAHR